MSSLTRKRIVFGVGMLIALFFVANYYLGLGLLGQFGRKAMVLSLIVYGGAIVLFAPSLQELREYREQKRASRSR